MKNAILERPDIRLAISDLRSLLKGITENIEEVSLFGSTVSTPVKKAKDIDFFIAYKDIQFDKIRHHLLSTSIGRHVVVETIVAQYTNHPEWPKEDPVRIHIILYRKGISKFSEKLERTKINSIDISKEVI
jgi:predicted nucleotidyltransferase